MHKGRQVIALLIFLPILAGCAAPGSTDNEWMDHEIVKEYPELSRSDIQTGIEQWLPELFHHAGAVIRQSDAAAGRIVATGVWTEATEYAPSMRANIRFTLNIEVSDEKARYRLDSLRAVSSTDQRDLAPVERSRQFHMDAETEFQRMIEKLSTALTSKVSDW
jgi:Leu/Phe-tRNA-protein transferase